MTREILVIAIADDVAFLEERANQLRAIAAPRTGATIAGSKRNR
jgi:hypothetical protein